MFLLNDLFSPLWTKSYYTCIIKVWLLYAYRTMIKSMRLLLINMLVCKMSGKMKNPLLLSKESSEIPCKIWLMAPRSDSKLCSAGLDKLTTVFWGQLRPSNKSNGRAWLGVKTNSFVFSLWQKGITSNIGIKTLPCKIDFVLSLSLFSEMAILVTHSS